MKIGNTIVDLYLTEILVKGGIGSGIKGHTTPEKIKEKLQNRYIELRDKISEGIGKEGRDKFIGSEPHKKIMSEMIQIEKKLYPWRYA
jgi:hypothetical protein